MKLNSKKFVMKYFSTTNTTNSIIKKTIPQHKISSPVNNLRRIKSFVEVLSSKGIEQDFNFMELKRFLKLTKLSRDFIETKIVDSIELKEQLSLIISKNNSLDTNLDLTKFLFYDIQREKNDFLFKNLLANLFSLIKIADEDSSLAEYIPYINMNIKTVNPQLVMKSDLLFETVQSVTKDLNMMKNYKGISTNSIVNYLSIFPQIKVNITQEEFFNYHFGLVINEKVNSLNIDIEAFDYFNFFLNFKNCLVDIKQRISMKNKFKEFFRNQMINFISNEQDGLRIMYRFDNIFSLINNFKDDSKFVNICEYILNMKLQEDVCDINTLIEITNFYIENKMLNKTMLLFISFNLIEHLKASISIHTFEKKVLPLFGIICENYNLCLDSETLSEFCEEFRSCIFHNRFLNSNFDDFTVDTENENNNNNMFNNITISLKTFAKIKHFHLLLHNSNYFDYAFDNFLNKTINLNQTLSFIP